MRPLLALCALLIAARASAAIPSSERTALLDLYQSTNGANWSNNSKWLSSEPECTWYGVVCDETQSSVIHLELYDNNLDGTLPRSIRNFTKLRFLQLWDNQLRDELPAELGELANLEMLYVHRNQLTGSIPASFGALKKMDRLGLDGNQLGGELPAELGDMSAMVELGLSNNAFTGPIPASLAKLTNLEMLELSVNQLSGEIPAALGALSKLQRFQVPVNQLTGELPASLSDLTSLISFRAGYNQLTGRIPASIGKLRALEQFDVQNNQLGGQLPDAIGDLSSLKTLNLLDNQFSGAIPTALFRLSNLEELLLGGNHFSGPIPAQLAGLRNLQVLSLNGNDLTGTIPVELSTIPPLRSFELQSNDLEGPIPQELSRLTNLVYLDLSGNRLSGAIPAQLATLPNLEILSLYDNALEGTIPPQLGDLPKLRLLYLGINQLTGTIPDNLRRLTGLEQFTANGNQLSGQIPSWIGEWTSLTDLFLGYNKLEGPLPAGLATLSNLTYLDLGDNQLSGSLIDFSGMTKLIYLTVQFNHFSGPLPSSIGLLSNLTFAALNANNFSGPLPPQIGNLSSIEYLALDGNDFDGPLPKELAKLKTAYNLGLCCNHFSGPIPAELAELTSLQFLGLSFNKLEGPIPAAITKMTGLEDYRSDFAYNGLYASDAATREFVNLKHYDGDFEATQTVKPDGFRLVDTTDRSATFALEPIRYSYYGGGYQVVASKTPGGPAAVVATTNSKSEDTITVRNLEPSTTYHFTVATVSHPISGQENLVVSDRSAPVQGTTKARAIAPAEVVVTEQTEGLVQIDGVEVVGDRFTVTNFGDVSTDVTLEYDDNAFYTAEPKQFAIAGGASRIVTIKSTPQPPGTYYGYISIRGQGVADGAFASVILLSVKRPAGTVVAQPLSTTIELAGEPGSDSVGIAQFRNTGTAELTGIVVSDQPWVVPDPQPITIAPGTVGSVNFRVVRSKRPAGADGALTANLSLVYVDGGLAAGIGISDTTTGVSISKVTIIDTTKPPVTPGSIPSLSAGEIPLFIAGVANRGNVRSDVSLVNAFGGSAIGDVRLYFSSGAATNVASLQPLRSAQSVNLVNVAANIYGVTNSVGTLQIRSTELASIASEAKVTAVTPAGTYSGSLPVFRGDRSIPPNERIYLAGVVAGGDVFVQETGGTDSRVAIEFLDASGNPAGNTRSENVAAYGLLELRGVIPANAATAIVTSGGPGAITAYARLTDATTGDSWSVVDWGRFYRYSNADAVRIPFADGQAATTGGGGGKRRSVRSEATGFRASTDLVVFNPSTSEVRATLRLVAANGIASERTITVAPRATITLRDAAGTSSTPTAHVLVTPLRGSLVVTARSQAGTYGTAIPVLAATQGLRLGQSQVFSSLEDSTAFKTSYGLVETTGAPVSVRARILIGETNALVTATTTRTFELAAGQQVFLPELLRSFAGNDRDGFGDLHDLTVEFEVTGGNGSVVPFLVVTDTGTGDPVMKIQ